MQFTYNSYISLLQNLRKHEYNFVSYHNWEDSKKCVILRHDVDYKIEKSYHMADIENDMGVASTYFVLVTSDFYNIFSKKNMRMLKSILALGHEIGLHFDETVYSDIAEKPEKIIKRIIVEKNLLEQAIEVPVETVSMHRPSQMILNKNLKIPQMVNSYENTFFRDFKYISDSRRRWKEPVEDIIAKEQYSHIHILVHPFWYHNEEQNIHDDIYYFINQENVRCYETFKSNFTDLKSVMKEEEILTIR